jgi:N-acetylmuramoyl-L-alanine amidase
MSRLARLHGKLRDRQKKRDRQARLFRRTRKRGHARAAKTHARAVRYLRKLILEEEKRAQETRIIPRSEWGAAPPNGGYVRQGTLIAGVQHHTAMPTLPADATVEQEKQRMRDIQRIHQGQGWTDIGYAIVVFPSGRMYEGRPAWAVGAHTLGHNTGYAGWAADGNYESSQPTSLLLEACHRARVALGVADKPLYGHYQLGATACPGKNLKPHLDKEI